MKLYCTNCGAELPKNAKFCKNCGTKVVPAESVTSKENDWESQHDTATVNGNNGRQYSGSFSQRAARYLKYGWGPYAVFISLLIFIIFMIFGNSDNYQTLNTLQFSWGALATILLLVSVVVYLRHPRQNSTKLIITVVALVCVVYSISVNSAVYGAETNTTTRQLKLWHGAYVDNEFKPSDFNRQADNWEKYAKNAVQTEYSYEIGMPYYSYDAGYATARRTKLAQVLSEQAGLNTYKGVVDPTQVPK